MSPSAHQLEELLHKVQRRELYADLLFGLSRFALPTCLFLGTTIVLLQESLQLQDSQKTFVQLSIFVPILVLIPWSLFRKRNLRTSARKLDRYYKLHDRIGNALEFSRSSARLGNPQSREIADLAIHDGLRVAKGLKAAPVVPLRILPPRRLDYLAASLLAVALIYAWWAPTFPGNEATSSVLNEGVAIGTTVVDLPPGPQSPETLLEDLRRLSESQDASAELSREMLNILGELEGGRLSPAEALEKLEKLQARIRELQMAFEEELKEDPELLAEAMRRAGEELRPHPIADDVRKALQTKRPEDIQKALDDLFKKGEENPERDRALKALERALKQSAQQNTSTSRELNQAERRLSRQEKHPHSDPREQERRLQKHRENVERLRRQQQREQAAKKALEKLRRLSRQARNSGNAQKRKSAQQKLGKGMAKAGASARKSRRLQGAQEGSEEAIHFVRRSGKKSADKQRRGQQKKAFSKAAKGKKGKGKGNKGTATLLVEGKVSEGGQRTSESGPGDPAAGDESSPREGSAEGQASGQEMLGSLGSQGNGHGQGTQDSSGEETKMDVKSKNVRVNAQKGRGLKRAEVIYQASQEGFASESYRETYEDYRSFAQSSMDKDSISPAQRRRIRRYYNMIQPRE